MISRSQLNLSIDKIAKTIRFNKNMIIPTSANKKIGVEKIESILDEYIK